MPLVKGCSEKAFQENVRRGVKEGQDTKQAVAVAFSQLKRSCGVDTDERLSAKEIVARGGKTESRMITLEQLYLARK